MTIEIVTFTTTAASGTFTTFAAALVAAQATLAALNAALSLPNPSTGTMTATDLRYANPLDEYCPPSAGQGDGVGFVLSGDAMVAAYAALTGVSTPTPVAAWPLAQITGPYGAGFAGGAQPWGGWGYNPFG